jgi:hypothetical protein
MSTKEVLQNKKYQSSIDACNNWSSLTDDRITPKLTQSEIDDKYQTSSIKKP